MRLRLMIPALTLALLTRPALTQVPVVHVAQGALAGSATDGVSSFKGVPYAAPPVDNLRWKAPAPAAPWTGVRQAQHFGSACMQNLRRDTLPWTHEFMVQNSASEDCLFLNVWTRQPRESAKLPVLLFIHGGGFNEGSGGIDVYDGTHLAQQGVVVVTINYRLGVLGFMAHPALTAESPTHSSGNYGLLDCLEALRWVHANIRAFGGDPGRVTIWGQSAGAAAVGALLASPVAKGMFSAAIADSGLGHAGGITPSLHDAEQEGEVYEKALGAASLADLRAMPADQLLKSTSQPNVHFRPDVDGTFLTEPPATAIEDGTGSDVPLLTGYQSEDARTLTRPDGALAAYDKRIHATYGTMADEAMRLYPVTGGDKGVQAASESMSHDRNRVNQWLLATRRAAHTHSATYTYYMDQAIPWPQHPQFGAFHTGELPYAFANLDKLDRPWTGKDREVSRTLSGYIVNFVRTGSPNGAGLPEWPRVITSEKQTMELGQHFRPMPLADAARVSFWQAFLTSDTAGSAPRY